MSDRVETRMRSREDFPALDALRGVAAAGVVLFHLRLGGPVGFASGYLAVDLFFLLSGFVIAHAYGEAMARSSMSFREFAKIRFVRLWPLYAIASLAAGLIWIATALVRDGSVWGSETQAFLGRAIAGFFFVPNVWERGELYPLLPVAWSLFYEVVANLVFALWPRSWSAARLVLVVVASVAAALLAAIYLGGWDKGWRAHEALFAVPRTFSAFFGGVLLYRFRSAIARRVPKVPVALLLVILVVTMNGPAPHSAFGLAYGFLFSTLISPVLVIFAVAAGPSRFDGVHRWLGTISYPVYVLQNVAVLVAAIATRLLHLPGQATNVVLAVLLVLAASPIVRWIDLPIRKWLASRLLARPALARTPANEEAAP